MDGFKAVGTHPGYMVNASGVIVGPSGAVLRPMINESGYAYILAPPPRRPRKMFVHRAVLVAFKGEPEPGQQCRHLNGDRLDNRIENLEWGTQLEQADDKRAHGTMPIGERSGAAKLTERDVAEIRRQRSLGDSLRAIAARFGVSHTAIRRASVGLSWAHVGAEVCRG